ncbi:MAG: hypothetical protein AAF938_20395, partial [Myxococcota bacterium]
MRVQFVLLSFLSFILGSCSGGGGERSLQVNVRTDFAPLIDFSEVTVEVAGQIRRFEVRADQNFIRGVRVAEFEELAESNVSVRAALVMPSGARVLDRLVEARVTGPTTVTSAARTLTLDSASSSNSATRTPRMKF